MSVPPCFGWAVAVGAGVAVGCAGPGVGVLGGSGVLPGLVAGTVAVGAAVGLASPLPHAAVSKANATKGDQTFQSKPASIRTPLPTIDSGISTLHDGEILESSHIVVKRLLSENAIVDTLGDRIGVSRLIT